MRFQVRPDSEAFSNVSVSENEGLRFRSLQCGREVKTYRKRTSVVEALSNRENLAGCSVAMHVNYCKSMENYQFFRRATSFGGGEGGGTHAQGVFLGRSALCLCFCLDFGPPSSPPPLLF